MASHKLIILDMMNSLYFRCLAFSFCSLTIGCNPFEGFRPNSEELLKLGWAKQPDPPKIPDPIYCYETLGQPVCHSAPLATQSRLNSYYGPQP